jgi:hypothetical protein
VEPESTNDITPAFVFCLSVYDTGLETVYKILLMISFTILDYFRARRHHASKAGNN